MWCCMSFPLKLGERSCSPATARVQGSPIGSNRKTLTCQPRPFPQQRTNAAVRTPTLLSLIVKSTYPYTNDSRHPHYPKSDLVRPNFVPNPSRTIVSIMSPQGTESASPLNDSRTSLEPSRPVLTNPTLASHFTSLPLLATQNRTNRVHGILPHLYHPHRSSPPTRDDYPGPSVSFWPGRCWTRNQCQFECLVQPNFKT